MNLANLTFELQATKVNFHELLTLWISSIVPLWIVSLFRPHMLYMFSRIMNIILINIRINVLILRDSIGYSYKYIIYKLADVIMDLQALLLIILFMFISISNVFKR